MVASAAMTLEIHPAVVQMGLLVFPVSLFLERIAVWTAPSMAFAGLVFLQEAHRPTHIGLTQLAQEAISTVNVSHFGVASFVMWQDKTAVVSPVLMEENVILPWQTAATVLRRGINLLTLCLMSTMMDSTVNTLQHQFALRVIPKCFSA